MDQDSLRRLWLHGQEGRLSPWEQAKALGLREASRDIHHGKTNLPWIAARLTKIGGGHPTKGSLHEFFKRVDSDDAWFPGKHNGKKRGPKPLLTPAKRRNIAQSATAAKKTHGNEPCVAAVVHGDMHTGVGLIHMSPGQIPRSHERQFERMKEKALQPRSVFTRLYGDSQS